MSSDTPIIGQGKTGGQLPESPKPAKEKSKGVKIIQAMPAGAVNAMTGRTELAFFGLGDNGEIYLWHANERIWREQ